MTMTGWPLDSRQRLLALEEVDVFPGAPSPTFAVYAKLVARVLDVPTALVSFVSEDRQFFPALVGLAEPWATRRQTPLSMSFCQHVVTTDADLVVTDAVNDERVKDNLAIDELGVRAYLGVPMRAPGGETLGSLCAIDSRPRQWTDNDVATMHDIADALMTTIAWRTSEHRAACLASTASHELRTPLTRLRFELEELGHSVAVDAAVRHLADVSDAVDQVANAVSRDRVRARELKVDLLTVCRDVASQRSLSAAPLRVEGVPTVVRSLPAIVHHVIALLVGAAAEQPVGLVVGGNDTVGRVQMLSAAPLADPSVIEPTRQLLVEQLGGRLLERPSPEVALEVILPR
ncbi:MAG TPA: GAF domain-containing protein [Acidimicrobiales bacterium]|nr:GAF domain-containing protein [Acidimicrobiales bacterium]